MLATYEGILAVRILVNTRRLTHAASRGAILRGASLITRKCMLGVILTFVFARAVRIPSLRPRLRHQQLHRRVVPEQQVLRNHLGCSVSHRDIRRKAKDPRGTCVGHGQHRVVQLISGVIDRRISKGHPKTTHAALSLTSFIVGKPYK